MLYDSSIVQLIQSVRIALFYPLHPTIIIEREVRVTLLAGTRYNPDIDYEEGSDRVLFVVQRAVIPRRRTVIANKLIHTAT